MNERERAPLQTVNTYSDQLALYDRYGSIAYGIILQILPQPQQAQEVLVGLFSSPELERYINYSGNTAAAIIRMARMKALEAKTRLGGPLPQPIDPSVAKTNLPDVVFELAFRQGYSIETIAAKLQIAKSEVLKAIQNYFVTFRQP